MFLLEVQVICFRDLMH